MLPSFSDFSANLYIKAVGVLHVHGSKILCKVKKMEKHP